MKDREARDAKLLEEKISEEIKGWSELVDKYSLELSKYKLICFYCGVELDDETINN